MRRLLLWGGLLGGMTLGATVWADTEPFVTEKKQISVPQAEVRSGPSTSPSMYATNTLHLGDQVEVIKNKGKPGWLAIKPPPGSFSWVNARFVRQDNDHTGIVLGEDTEVMMGSPLNPGPPSVRATPLPRGAILTIIGQPLRASDGTRWLPIQPHATEIRYIAADAVKPGAAALQSVAARPQPEVLKSLYDQALRAEQARNNAEAQRLWYQLADQTTDPRYKRLYQDRAASFGPSGGGTAPATLTGRIVPNQSNQATSLYGAPQWTAPGAGPGAQQSQWTGPGYLFKAGFPVEGKPVYRLESKDRATLSYITPQPGFSLDQYVNRYVQVYGPVEYHGNERINLQIANNVKPVQ